MPRKLNDTHKTDVRGNEDEDQDLEKRSAATLFKVPPSGSESAKKSPCRPVTLLTVGLNAKDSFSNAC